MSDACDLPLQSDLSVKKLLQSHPSFRSDWCGAIPALAEALLTISRGFTLVGRGPCF